MNWDLAAVLSKQSKAYEPFVYDESIHMQYAVLNEYRSRNPIYLLYLDASRPTYLHEHVHALMLMVYALWWGARWVACEKKERPPRCGSPSQRLVPLRQ